MKTRRIIALVLCAVMMVSSLSACGSSESTSSKKDTVAIYVNDIFNTLNPLDTNAFSDQDIFSQCYETLAMVDNEGTPQPYLAKSWEVSDDGLVYTVHLVEDSVFHNGEKVTADDVVFTYTYAKEHPARQFFYKMVDSVVALDDFTVEFTLNTPTPMFMAHSQQIAILNRKFVEEHNGDISSVECGSGPYTVESYDSASTVKLTAYKDYRLGEASIKNVELRYYSDSSSAQVAFENGELDFMRLDPNNAEQFSSDEKYTVVFNNPMYTAVIAMNNNVAPFDNKLIRQAFAYAADRESMIQVMQNGYAIPARFMCYDENCWGVDYGDAPNYTYDPAKAKELLAEAGYPNGLNLADFNVTLKTFSGHAKIATIYQQNLADIGVTVEIVNTSTPDEDVESGDFCFMNQGITYRSDFSYSECHYGSAGIGGNNYAQVSDPYVDEMFAKALEVSADDDARAAVYSELVPYLIDYCPNVYLYHRQNVYAWNSGLNANVKDNNMFTYHVYEWSWK